MSRMFERQDRRTFNLKPRYWDPEKEEREEELAIESAKDSFDFIDGMGLEDTSEKSNETSLWESNIFQEEVDLVRALVIVFFVS